MKIEYTPKTLAFILSCTLLLAASACRSPISDSHPDQIDSGAPDEGVSHDSLRPINTYSFPNEIDRSRRYMFYLHGRILEDQELPAISERFGEYEYTAILSRLSMSGSIVVSEKRAANTSVSDYARKISEQIESLLAENVPANSITVVGASKGSYIAATVSHILMNSELNFVLLGSCHSSVVAPWLDRKMRLYGNVLAIRDHMDADLAGSCDELASLSKGAGLANYQEIVLRVGTGHGILYKPLDQWVEPTIRWGQADYQ
jgi:hypothetical protein